MFKNFKIVTRITSLIIIGAGLIIALLSTYDYYSSRSIIENELRERARNLARATANEMEVVNRAVEKIVNELAISLRESPLDQINLDGILMETMNHHLEIDGVGILLDQYTSEKSMLYGYRKDDLVHVEDVLKTADYNYLNDDWYGLAVYMGAGWSEPYYGSVSGKLRVTYAVELENSKGNRIGVVMADVDLQWLSDSIQQLKVGNRGKAFVTSRNGRFIAYPEYEFIMRESFFSLARELNRPLLHELGKKMQAGESDFVQIKGFREDRDYWLAYTNIADSGWALGVLFDRSELYSQLLKLIRDKVIYGIVCAMLLFFIALWIARSISQPIQKLETAANLLSTGDLDTKIPLFEGKNEIASLSQSFGQMRRDLREHIDALEDATTEQARIDSDLQTAKNIQTGLLPTNFDDLNERCCLHAFLQPAKEVGGDFYDFVQLDDDRVFFAIGDATGKGVPAALFVALTRTMLRIYMRNHSPAEAMAQVNNELAADNDASMFVTLFVGVLNLQTGELKYANGGHNPPLLLKKDASEPEFLPETTGMVVGPLPDMPYEDGACLLNPGDRLLLYTDGIVEAEDGDAFYGEDRMLNRMIASRNESPEVFLNALHQDVIDFRGSFEQSDDITILAVELSS